MKALRVSSTAAVFLLCGMMGVTSAQERQQKVKQTKPDQQQGRPQQAARQHGNAQHPQGQQALRA